MDLLVNKVNRTASRCKAADGKCLSNSDDECVLITKHDGFPDVECLDSLYFALGEPPIVADCILDALIHATDVINAKVAVILVKMFFFHIWESNENIVLAAIFSLTHISVEVFNVFSSCHNDVIYWLIK